MAFLSKNSSSEYAARAILQPGQKEISSRLFNVIIGSIITYGFVLNTIIVYVFQNYLKTMSYSSMESFAKNYNIVMMGSLIGYIFCAIIGNILLSKKNPGISFLGFHFLAIPIGILLEIGILPYYSMNVIISALAMTAILTVVMIIVSTIMPDAFLSMGRSLCIASLACITVDLIAVFLFRRDLTMIDIALTLIFALFIGYDWARASTCAKTVDNAIDCAALLYMNIINLFLRILSVLGKKKN